MKQTIEQRIVTILNNEKSSAAEIAEIVREAKSAAQTADQAVEAERIKAMDVVRSPNIEDAHRAVAEAVLARERLRALLVKLRTKLSEAQAAETQERWQVEFNRVEQKRDEAAAAFRRYLNSQGFFIYSLSLPRSTVKSIMSTRVHPTACINVSGMSKMKRAMSSSAAIVHRLPQRSS